MAPKILRLSNVHKKQSAKLFLTQSGWMTQNLPNLKFTKNALHAWGEKNEFPKSKDQAAET